MCPFPLRLIQGPTPGWKLPFLPTIVSYHLLAKILNYLNINQKEWKENFLINFQFCVITTNCMYPLKQEINLTAYDW